MIPIDILSLIPVVVLAVSAAAHAAEADAPLFGATAAGRLYVGHKRANEADLLLRSQIGLTPNAADGAGRNASAASAPPAERFALPLWTVDMTGGLSSFQLQPKLASHEYWLRWHICGGNLWYLGCYREMLTSFPIMRLPLGVIPFSNFHDKPIASPLDSIHPAWPERKATGWRAGPEWDGSASFPWVASTSPPLRSAATQESSARFDIFPESAHSCLAFANTRKKRIEQQFIPSTDENSMFIFRYRFEAVRSPVRPDISGWNGNWTEADRLSSEFVEPFRAVVVGGYYFFVTQSGRLYQISRKPVKDRRMQLIWDTASRKPIVAMLEDSDSDKTYAFSVDQFFEVASKIRPQPCDIGPADEIKPDDPLPVLRRCAQTLVQRGLIKLPDARELRPPKTK